jgi:tetratricopeptide (TPR) repeat protein
MKKTTLISLFACLILVAVIYGTTSSNAQSDATPATASTDTQTAPAATADQTSAPTTVSEKILAHLRNFLSPIRQIPSSQQQRAVELARQGQYDEALDILEKLHQRDKSDVEVTRDYTTVLGWAGHDQQAVDLYDTLPSHEPDYVLAAIGHSYRKLGQTDKALDVYRKGLKRYPDNVLFAEGEIRCIADTNDLEGALAKANDDLGKHGIRTPIATAKGDILQAMFRRDEQKAVELARQQSYPEAINRFHDLYAQHSDDVTLTRDYLATLDWQGGNDEQVVALYKTLPPGEQPDYVLEATGHAYRNLKQYDKAEGIYEEGVQRYPDSVLFTEGYIRSLVDQKKYDLALAKTDQDLRVHGQRPAIVDIRKNILRLKPHGNSHRGSKAAAPAAATTKHIR